MKIVSLTQLVNNIEHLGNALIPQNVVGPEKDRLLTVKLVIIAFGNDQ
jgi:hypothetical protein